MAVKCTGKMLKKFLSGTYNPNDEPGALFDFRTIDDAATVEIDGNEAKINGMVDATNLKIDEGSMENIFVRWLKESPTTFVMLEVPWDKETAVRLAVANVLLKPELSASF